ncbi:flavin-containing monooxygenase [Cytobacillus horneckiae]|uniref:flavin-containing monooxygenase n=1 Tax=Cytobacillus horneckiae TaxID=549687 RepID=UPI00204238B0|nr:NAD(P)/FAD-dependent oxidoreductase [Cytobacillus horneckiae]MCM3180460.1 NAD(P)/FAD-dependent oxidoreductase [Cytobacillus horneckiae]
MVANQKYNQTNQNNDFDAIVIGAGFSGLYMLHRLREAGLSTRVFESNSDVGGVWYVNRYPGARCDSDSIIYNYTFSEEILQEWTWTSRFPEQEEILSYLNFVANKLDLRRDIQFNTRIIAAHYDEINKRWRFQTEEGTSLTAKYFISGIGFLSTANIPKFKGLDSFKGDWYHTGNWPHEKVDFKGKRVGVIGTGSSGIQSIPIIAQEADHLTVFQRTPGYCTPARNHPYDPEFISKTKANYSKIRNHTRNSKGGYLDTLINNRSALDDTLEERQREYEKVWEKGGFSMQVTYNDLMVNPEANDTAAEFIRSKISEIVNDQEVAEKLKPKYYYGGKRPVLDTNYYETYNRENVALVDVKSAPIAEITPNGIRTTEHEYELDIIVFATGFDGMTGPLFKIDIRGKDGLSLKEKWVNGAKVKTYLGIANAGFPNMFMITGPQSPSALSNLPVSIEQHVEWIGDCIEYLRKKGVETIEANIDAEEAWSKHCKELADQSLYTKADSWYTGANIEGKPRSFLIYIGGVQAYRQKCDEIAVRGYDGFSLTPARDTVL